ncbi:MAG: SMC-Scp complex subunit ScpB [Clostridiales bacterium]|jgi:segregation and condensation protein B|nr:SMC-Scp complex subunit ScpB [Clostridiales bacterium]
MTENEKILEAMLFASGEAVPISMLSMAMGLTAPETRVLLENIERSYEKERRGFSLIRVNDAYQLSTNPIYYDHIRRLIQTPQRKLLTQTLMETLSIIAYKQPVTKAQIEEIRGVNADHAVNKLMEYNLISEKGRLDSPGKPILFGTSDDFLRYFGLESTEQLPTIESADSG